MRNSKEEAILSDFTVVPLAQAHLDRAAGMFCEGYRHLREAMDGLMPARWQEPAEVSPLINSLHGRYPMVAAVGADGRLVGYLGGMLLAEFKGKDKGAYCPEWGHAVDTHLPATQRHWVYRRMYEAIGDIWVRDGRLNQAITVLAHDSVALRAWFWSTFGLLVVDAVRDLSPVAGAAAGRRDGETEAAFTVRAVQPNDNADMARLFPVLAEHEAFYAGSPIWLPKAPLSEREAVDWVGDPKSVVWIAEERDTGEIIGMCRHTIDSDNSSTVVRDDATIACTGAYVVPRARRGGVGTALLGAMVDWGRDNDYKRLSLDFEAANIHGGRFWLKHLRPVCYSVIRHVNDKVAGGGGAVTGGSGGGSSGGGGGRKVSGL